MPKKAPFERFAAFSELEFEPIQVDREYLKIEIYNEDYVFKRIALLKERSNLDDEELSDYVNYKYARVLCDGEGIYIIYKVSR